MTDSEVISLYQDDNLSTYEIARMFNTYPAKIRRILVKHGVDMKNAGYYKIGAKNPLYSGYEGITGSYWGHIQGAAARRSLAFEITKEQAWDLLVKQNFKCALTGLDIVTATSCEEYYNGTQTASIDRIDSDKHYTLDNIQWVHKEINIMKREYSQEKFIEYCKLVAKHKGN
jgi:hypothetical protein